MLAAPLPEDGLTRTADVVPALSGERCAHCQAPLASDQRYCLSCGERRGKPRFSALPVTAAVASAGEPPLPPFSTRSRAAAGGTLLAGVATLLVAMGVGVLIGHNSGASATRASDRVQVITLGAGGAASAAAPTAAPRAGASSGRRHRTSAHAKAPKTVVVHLTPKVSSAATQAAGKVFGSNGGLSSNVTQQQGGACSGGAGCQNGKFTGQFFP